MGGGAGGEEGEGVCGRGSGGVRQLMVRAPAGHTGASRWRTSEPPHSSTKTLPTLAPCCPASNPKSLNSQLSLFHSVLLSLSSPSIPTDTFSFFIFVIQLIQIQIHLLFGRLLISHCAFSGRCLFFWGFLFFLFLHIHHSFPALSLPNLFT